MPKHRWAGQTNPRNTGWYDDANKENSGKCKADFVGANTLANGAKWNQRIDGKKWYIQGNWLNKHGGRCVLSGIRFTTGYQAATGLLDLASHIVDCPPASLLSLFRLQNNAAAGEARFWYQCMPIDRPDLLTSPGAPKLSISAVATAGSLDPLVAIGAVRCGINELLQKFAIINNASSVQVQYSCASCTPICDPVKSTLKTADPQDGLPLSILNYHDPHCASASDKGVLGGKEGLGADESQSSRAADSALSCCWVSLLQLLLLTTHYPLLQPQPLRPERKVFEIFPGQKRC